MNNGYFENVGKLTKSPEGFYKEATNLGTDLNFPGFMASLFNRLGWRLRCAASSRFSLQRPVAFTRINQLAGVVILVATLCLLSGCVTAGENLDRSAIAKLQQGQTRDEVRKVFGSPKQTEMSANGKRLDYYKVIFVRGAKPPLRAFVVRSLDVLYDDAGRVERFKHHVGELPIRETQMGWEAGVELDEATIREIQREVHGRPHMQATFGPPIIEGLSRDGEDMVSWYFITGNRRGYMTGHELQVKYDTSDRVKDYLFREIQR